MLGPHTHTPVPTASGWRTPTARPVGGQSGEGQRLTSDAPHNGGRHPPPETPFRHPHSEQRRPARAHAVGPVLGPHARTDRTRDTRVAEPWLPAPGDRRPGEGQRLTPDAPHNGGRHPPGDTLSPPPQRAAPARKGARCGTGAGSPRPHRPHPEHTGRGTPAARPRGRAVRGGTAPDSRRPSQQWQATPPGDGPPPPPRHAAPTGRAGQGDSFGPPHPHARANSTRVADPNSPPGRRAVGGGGAPHLRRPSQRWKAPPPATSFRQPHSEQRRPAEAHAVGPMLGPHARTNRTRDTRVAGPRRPAPEDGRQGEGQRLTPDAPRNGGRPPPRGRPPTTPAARSPNRACRRRGQCWAPTPTSPHPQRMGDGSQQPAQWVGSRGRGSARPPTPLTMVEGTPPRGRPSASPTASNAGPQGRTLWGRCWVPTPAPTAPRTHESRNPGRPPQRTGGRGGGQRLTPDAPHNGGRPPPPGTAPHHPRGTQPPQGMQAKGTVLGPQTHTPAPTARG